MRKTYLIHGIGLFVVCWELVICFSSDDKLPFVANLARELLK